MRKNLFLFLSALLLPVCSVFAGGNSTTYYSKLTVQRAGTGEGKIYASDGASANPAYQTAAMTVSKSGTSQSQTYNIYAEAPAGTKFTGWTASGATVANATALATTATINASGTSSSAATAATVTANFEEESFASFSVTYAKPENGSITVDGADVGAAGLTTGPFTKVYTPTLVASAAAGYVFDGWYSSTDGEKALLSRSSTYEAAFEAATTVYAEFAKAVQVTTYEALVSSVAANVCTEIPVGTTIAIPSSATLTVNAGKQLVVNGTINLLGKIANSGVIGGSGTINLIKYEITQTGNGANPIVTETIRASDQKKYYKTTVATVSSAISGTAATCNLVNGARAVRNGTEIAVATYPTNVTPAVFACSITSGTALNHITGFSAPSYYESVGKGMAAVKSKGTTQMLVLLADKTLNQTDASSAGILVTQGNYQKLDGNFGTIDLAGKKLTINTSYINSYSHTVLGGSLQVSTLMYSGTVTAINCSSVVFSKIKEDYASVINIYDLTGTGTTAARIISAYNGSNAIKNAVNFYSSSTAIYTASQFLTKAADSYHIYGGKWSAQPDAKYIASVLASDYAFYQNDAGKWELQTKANREVVEVEGGSAYESFDEAITAALASDSAKLTLLKSATLASPITIPAGKTLELELAGCALTASTGFAINHGTLILGDNKANLASTGGRIVTTSGNLIENDGTVDVTYGYYTGNVVLSGGTFTTHHGRFEGAFSGEKEHADLRGGYFAKDVSSLLQEGYYRTNGYVGPFPPAAISKTWVSSNGGYWKYSFKTLPEADLTLYNNASNGKSAYTLANWVRRAELRSMIEQYPPASYMVDIAAGFDRAIDSGSASATVSKPVSITQALPSDVAAGELYRILSPFIVSQNSTQKKYSAFLSESTFQDTIFGMYSTADANKGTTVNLRIDLCVGSNEAPTSKYALMSEYAVIGAGSNEAMIQPASGKATFYATISAAVEAAEAGATIKLCNDVTSTDEITISKACTIDTNGMTFKGSIVAGQGCELTTSSTTLPVEKMLGKVHTTYTIVKTAVEPEIEYAEVPVKMTEGGTITPQAPQNGSVVIVNASNSEISAIDIAEQTSAAEVYTITKTTESGTVETKLGVIKAKEEETEIPEGKDEPAAVTVAVAVPFKGATVANLLNTALLKEGDMLQAYINGEYAIWMLQPDKTWKGVKLNKVSGDDSEVLDPAKTTLARGTAVWVTSAEKIVALGSYEDTEEANVPAANDLKTGHNFLGNAKMEESTPEGVANGLQVQIIGDTDKVRYNKTASGWSWSKTTTVTIGGKEIKKESKGTDAPSIPVGGAFWLVK